MEHDTADLMQAIEDAKLRRRVLARLGATMSPSTAAGTKAPAHFHRGHLLSQIQETLRSGLRVQVSNYLHSTVYDQRHADMFRAVGPSLYVQHGRKWLCVDGCSIRFERRVAA